MLLQRGPAGDHADAASWGHGTALSRIWERDHRSTPDVGRHRTALSGVRQGDHRGLAAGGTGLGGVGGEGFGREAVEGFHMKSRTSSAFLLSVWAALSYSGDGRGVTGVTAPFFRERGGEAGRKEHRPDLEGKDTRRGAKSGNRRLPMGSRRFFTSRGRRTGADPGPGTACPGPGRPCCSSSAGPAFGPAGCS